MSKFKLFISEENLNEGGVPLLGIRDFKDGLTLKDIQANPKWHWIIMGGIKNAVIGKKGNKLVWYSGDWVFGTWQEKYAIWKKGTWKGGTDSKGEVHIEGDSPNKW